MGAHLRVDSDQRLRSFIRSPPQLKLTKRASSRPTFSLGGSLMDPQPLRSTQFLFLPIYRGVVDLFRLLRHWDAFRHGIALGSKTFSKRNSRKVRKGQPRPLWAPSVHLYVNVRQAWVPPIFGHACIAVSPSGVSWF